ncbi:MBL fold metallo-hydrolase [Bermanella marisrubri]|uniref:Beta-lactamase-like protein n=1 Tax=Bermanella marisrubri TaxID=207949 RepID=Q1MXX4_9GAMM|nr:MBL fold metallo-hydrolase [Bermanella marisrubri]EAT10804.1 Beta-lactamase-like protein [Oceanobacter sp. RED65] [Bermanella marisrubri]QIZ82720.1 MBL fold metallo-hydrolase [Bermanella marisrubri]
MIFRQLFDTTSSTFTYLLADEVSKEAMLIDPVFEKTQRDLALVKELGLTLTLVADTHAHADHITAAWVLKQKTGCKIASAKVIEAEHVDIHLEHEQAFGIRGITLTALSTPGHTDGCMSFVLSDHSMVFTGDALLIRGCGRSDFQQGSAQKLYESITQTLFSLPNDCIVYPAHDYNGREQSTIWEEKQFNARVGGGANETDFVEYMHAMKLPHPKKIAEALPANLRSGCPEDGQLPPEPDWANLEYTYAGVPEIDSEWLEQNLSKVTLLDVRQEDELDTSNPLDADVAIPLGELRDRVGEVPKDKPVVAFCRSGRRSSLAINILKDAGHEQVANLKGGLIAI